MFPTLTVKYHPSKLLMSLNENFHISYRLLKLIEMRKELYERIKRKIHENIAPLYYGKVELNNLYRIFSSVANRSEIEKCIEELVKEGFAKKVETNKGKFYVFEKLAAEFGKHWKEKLNNSKMQLKKTELQEAKLRAKLEVLEEMRNIWLEDWDHVLKDPEMYAGLHNYISSVIFGQKIEKILVSLNDINKKIKTISKNIENLENKLKNSYVEI